MENLSRKVRNVLGLMSIWLTLPLITVAQTQTVQVAEQPLKASHWYFGDKAGLDFSNGHPVAVTDGAMQAFEGTASMSDKNGNLLFYTNGGSMPYAGGIWNRNHQLMPNGNLATAGGCSSSFQSSLIVNQPRSKDAFYLFTTDCIENNSQGGLRYSVIDMNLDGGLGDVVVKGVQLAGPTDESLTAAQHGNGKDWWIITHRIRTDSFYVYHLNHNGIVGVVKQKVGPVTPDFAGTIKVSVNGQKMVYAGLNWTYVFDFDILTGEISNPVDLQTPAYSAAFAPMCHYLYVADGIGKNIYQFDLFKSDVAATKTLIGTTASMGIGTMELGPDGRIYVARFTSSQYLGVINDPDYEGAASNYVDNGIHLAGKISKGGLPNFPNNYMGGCTGYPEENTSTNGALNAQLMMIDPNTAHINWNNLGGTPAYRVLTREAGTTNWTEIEVYGTETQLTGLSPETTYEVRVMEATTKGESYEPVYDHFTDVIINEHAGEENTTVSKTLTIRTPGVLDFNMYPNPANNNARITLNNGETTSNVTVRVVDIKGTVVNEMVLNGVSGIQQFDLPVYDLTNGIYNVMITSNNQSTAKKLVVMK